MNVVLGSINDNPIASICDDGSFSGEGFAI
jgi:hypothetical protein